MRSRRWLCCCLLPFLAALVWFWPAYRFGFLTDDFMIRPTSKEFWALNALLIGYGVRKLLRSRA